MLGTPESPRRHSARMKEAESRRREKARDWAISSQAPKRGRFNDYPRRGSRAQARSGGHGRNAGDIVYSRVKARVSRHLSRLRGAVAPSSRARRSSRPCTMEGRARPSTSAGTRWTIGSFIAGDRRPSPSRGRRSDFLCISRGRPEITYKSNTTCTAPGAASPSISAGASTRSSSSGTEARRQSSCRASNTNHRCMLPGRNARISS